MSSSTRRSTRGKAPAKSYVAEEVFAGLFADDDIHPPAPRPSRKRRRNSSSDDDSGKEYNGEGTLRKPPRAKARDSRHALTPKAPAGLEDHAPSGASAFQLQPSAVDPDATYVAEGDDSASEASLVDDDEFAEDELEALRASGDIDFDSDDDEGFIENPEGIAIEEEIDDLELDVEPTQHQDPQASDQASPSYEEDADQEFLRILRKCFQGLTDHAKSISYDDFDAIPSAERPYKFKVWRLLNRVSIDVLVRNILPAIPLHVQQVIAKKEWRLGDFLTSLSHPAGDTRPGVYVLFPSGNLADKPAIGCEAYVGVTKDLHARILGRTESHQRISDRYDPETLPVKFSGSLLYQESTRTGVRLNPRVIAAYDGVPDTTYQYLLEGVFMIVFNTYQFRGRYHRHNSQASYDLVTQIRGSLGLPEVSWKGMNGAWTLFQGLPGQRRTGDYECGNEACKALIPYKIDGKYAYRYLIDPSDPKSAYICKRCYNWRRSHGLLPTVAELAKCARFKAAVFNHQAVRDVYPEYEAPCSRCGRPECCLWKPKAAKPQWRHSLIPEYPGKLLCQDCKPKVRRLNFPPLPATPPTLSAQERVFVQSQLKLIADQGSVSVQKDQASTERRKCPKGLEGLTDAEYKIQLKEHQRLLTAATQRQNYRRRTNQPVECHNCGSQESEADRTSRDTRFRSTMREDGKGICSRCWYAGVQER
jgi:hypothetical protein